jgi:hypothetical protein
LDDASDRPQARDGKEVAPETATALVGFVLTEDSGDTFGDPPVFDLDGQTTLPKGVDFAVSPRQCHHPRILDAGCRSRVVANAVDTA